MLNLSSPGFHFRSFALILRRLDVNLRFSGFLSRVLFGNKGAKTRWSWMRIEPQRRRGAQRKPQGKLMIFHRDFRRTELHNQKSILIFTEASELLHILLNFQTNNP